MRCQMTQSEYPKHILPVIGWKIGIKASEILEICKSSIIGHRIDGLISDCTENRMGELHLKCEFLPTKRIPNLSSNLLGAKFQLEDFRFIQKNAGKEKWDGVCQTEDLLKDENYEEQTGDMFVIAWNIDDLEGFSIPYKRNFPKKNLYDEIKNKVLSSEEIYLVEYDKLPVDDNKVHYLDSEGEVHLTHEPTNLNYWHFTIDLFPLEDNEHPIKRADNAWQKMMADNVGDYLRKTFLLVPDHICPPKIDSWEDLVV